MGWVTKTGTKCCLLHRRQVPLDHLVVFKCFLFFVVCSAFVFRLKGPPPALEGPFAVNTRLQKGRRLFARKLHGPESFTADQDGERQIR